MWKRIFEGWLQTAFDERRPQFFSDLAALTVTTAFADRLKPLRRLPWCVYPKRPFGGPEQVLEYLGRYTHRVAIANSRLVALTDSGSTSDGGITATTTSAR